MDKKLLDDASKGDGAMEEELLGNGPTDDDCCAHCWGMWCVLFSVLISFALALVRNGGCDPEALRGVDPPFGGELMPPVMELIERRSWFQKYVDAYASDGTHIGYFYDMNFLLFMRFGFSDASHRIWFEAKYKSFLSRFQFNIDYVLQRCDVGAGGRQGGIFDIQEDWWARSWFCTAQTNCVKKFYIRRSDADAEDRAKIESGPEQVATAIFNSTRVQMWQSRWHAVVDQKGGMRQSWYLNLTDSATDEVIASAKQHFFFGGKLGYAILSNWSVEVKQEKSFLPNWVVGYMAALDDIEA